MKAIMLAVLLLAAGPVLAQVMPAVGTESPVPFKGANAIRLHTPDSAKVAYTKLAQSLLAAGYSLERVDKELGFIGTTFRPAPRYNMLYACRFYVKATATGSDIQASGAFTLPGAAAASAVMAGESPIQYRGAKASTFMVCWQAMQSAAANAYPTLPVDYLRLP